MHAPDHLPAKIPLFREKDRKVFWWQNITMSFAKIMAPSKIFILRKDRFNVFNRVTFDDDLLFNI